MFGKTFKNDSKLKNSSGTCIDVIINLQEERSLLQIYKFSHNFSNLLETKASTEEIPYHTGSFKLNANRQVEMTNEILINIHYRTV